MLYGLQSVGYSGYSTGSYASGASPTQTSVTIEDACPGTARSSSTTGQPHGAARCNTPRKVATRHVSALQHARSSMLQRPGNACIVRTMGMGFSGQPSRRRIRPKREAMAHRSHACAATTPTVRVAIRGCALGILWWTCEDGEARKECLHVLDSAQPPTVQSAKSTQSNSISRRSTTNKYLMLRGRYAAEDYSCVLTLEWGQTECRTCPPYDCAALASHAIRRASCRNAC